MNTRVLQSSRSNIGFDYPVSLKDEVLRSNHYRMLLYSDSLGSEVCTDVRNSEWGNLREKFNILIDYNKKIYLIYIVHINVY